MKTLFTILLALSSFLNFAQITIASWNIKDMGNSKSNDIISYMVETLRGFDVVAIQEVVAGYGGAQAVARLADELNRKGAKWDYAISDPTKSSPYSSERYAYLWKTNMVKIIGKPWLDQNFVNEIEREPYMMTIAYQGKQLTLVNFHAVPSSKQPEREIKYFKFLPDLYPEHRLVFMGDFNLPDHHTVFNPLKKKGYQHAFNGQKTSLRSKCDVLIKNDCLSKAYDHIFYPEKRIKMLNCGVIYFYEDFPFIKDARYVSDHIPVWIEFD
ncbi:MAG: endonuclease [Bacteroidetes bacterium]|jgi:endonuclease/exonuclease/phosphatase family metal-dependent hydrolase|nr:endonuclease [Bacteroidota bacterium]